MLPQVADDAGVSQAAAGQLVAASAVVAVAGLVLLGPLSDRYGKKGMLTIGLAAMALAAFGSSLTSSYVLLLALRILSGVADALVLPSAGAAVGDYFRGKDREVALNALLLPMGAAVVLGLPLVVLISDVADWQMAFLVFGLINLAVIAAVRAFLPPVTPEVHRPTTLAEHYRASYADVFGNRTAGLVLAAGILGAAVWNGMVTYAGALFEDEFGADAAGLSALFAAVGGSYVLGGAIGIGLARTASPRTIALGSALAATALLLPIVETTAIVPLATLLAMLFAASRAPGIAALNNMLIALAPRSQGTAVSAYGVVAASGAFLGAAAGGGAIAVGGYAGMALLFTALSGAAAILLSSRSEAELKAPATA